MKNSYKVMDMILKIMIVLLCIAALLVQLTTKDYPVITTILWITIVLFAFDGLIIYAMIPNEETEE